MIIGKDFAFFHIPKCGGTSIRHALAPWDLHDNGFWGRVVEPDGFHLDLAHMTPAMLRARRPEIFVQVEGLARYAILRDPADRLISSFNEHLRNFHHTSVSRLSPKRLLDLAAGLEEEIAGALDTLPAELVHFTPQSHYVTLDGAPFVTNLYRLDDLDRFRSDLNRRHGTTIAAFGQMRMREGKGLRLRFVPEHLVRHVNHQIWRYAPGPVHRVIKTLGRAALASDKGTSTADQFRASPAFEKLMERFYRDDLDLWARAGGA